MNTYIFHLGKFISIASRIAISSLAQIYGKYLKDINHQGRNEFQKLAQRRI